MDGLDRKKRREGPAPNLQLKHLGVGLRLLLATRLRERRVGAWEGRAWVGGTGRSGCDSGMAVGWQEVPHRQHGLRPPAAKPSRAPDQRTGPRLGELQRIVALPHSSADRHRS